MGKLLRSVDELLAERNEEVMRSITEREAGRACFYCGTPLDKKADRNKSGACKRHWNLLQKFRHKKSVH